MSFGLTSKDFNILLELAIHPLQKHGAKVWVFGSRARGDHKPFSDIDLMYKITTDLPLGLIYDITTNLEDSDLTIKVDLVNQDEIAQSYIEDALLERLEINNG